MKLDPHWLLIGASLLVVLSYLFNVISRRLNISSVILLIGTGIGINFLLDYFNAPQPELLALLELLGIVGLILIVLEAALDLKLDKSKWGLIGRSFFVALAILLITAFTCAWLINSFVPEISYYKALIYAVPISIMSSAIIIPSVTHLEEGKREFMIYESTFSDILGIIFFYFLIDFSGKESVATVSLSLLGNLIGTVLLAVVLTFAIIFLLQRITSRMKLFLSIAILLLIYSVGKLMHLSSLIFILVFGLILNNYGLFARGWLRKRLRKRFMLRIQNDFKFITAETAFLIRTFFFVIFGMTIDWGQMGNQDIYWISAFILMALYMIRYINLKLVMHTKVFPELYIAPRGLITILLFFSIPPHLLVREIESSILFVIIMSTSLIMMFALMLNGKSSSHRSRASASDALP